MLKRSRVILLFRHEPGDFAEIRSRAPGIQTRETDDTELTTSMEYPSAYKNRTVSRIGTLTIDLLPGKAIQIKTTGD